MAQPSMCGIILKVCLAPALAYLFQFYLFKSLGWVHFFSWGGRTCRARWSAKVNTRLLHYFLFFLIPITIYPLIFIYPCTWDILWTLFLNLLCRIQPVYVVDVAGAIVAALKDDGSSMGKTYELGGPDVFTMHQLVIHWSFICVIWSSSWILIQYYQHFTGRTHVWDDSWMASIRKNSISNC